MTRRKILCALLALLLTPLALHAAPPLKTRLLVTRPVKRYLSTFVTLVQRGILSAPNLELVGLFHEDQVDDFTATERYVREAGVGKWVRLEKLSGRLPKERIYRRNRLTSRLRRLFRNSDGVIFTGGPDLPPYTYGEDTSLLTLVKDPARHHWELSFLHHLLGGRPGAEGEPWLCRRPSYLVLCICLGMQSLNVAGGGTLVQDIPHEIYRCSTMEEVLALPPDSRHRNYERALVADARLDYGVLHHIRLLGTWPRELRAYGRSQPLVVSIHHQCIEALAPNLTVVARSMDGKIVEAVRHRRFKNVLGLQFHPERLALYDPDRPAYVRAEDIPRQTMGRRVARAGTSLAFHRALWSWVGSRLEQSAHVRRLRRFR